MEGIRLECLRMAMQMSIHGPHLSSKQIIQLAEELFEFVAFGSTGEQVDIKPEGNV